MHPIIPVFIGSPSDVKRERRLVERAVQIIAPKLSGLFGVTMVPLLWEQFAPISSGDASHPQIEILRRIEPYSIFVGILGRRYGTPLPGSNIAGTEAEFKHVLANRQRISILSYFRVGSSGNNVLDPRIDKLKRRLQRKKVWIADYQNVAAFAERIQMDLMETALKMILARGPTDLRRYNDFFRFGDKTGLGSSPIVIAYPTITETEPGRSRAQLPWQSMLLPRVVHEDLKAVQDVEGIMRILNREYRTVTTDSPELMLAPPGDRVWVCMPRNPKARAILVDLSRRVRFAFKRMHYKERSNEELVIQWKQEASSGVQVRSPLAAYLAKSKRPSKPAIWVPAYGYTYGRDYGVLARFEVSAGPPATEGNRYYHYFIGGLRGLGTWGVGWFLDHCAPQLEAAIKKSTRYKGQESNDAQLLVEVVYENYGIKSVEDVSDEDQAFFDLRISDDYIREQIEDAHVFS